MARAEGWAAQAPDAVTRAELQALIASGPRGIRRSGDRAAAVPQPGEPAAGRSTTLGRRSASSPAQHGSGCVASGMLCGPG